MLFVLLTIPLHRFTDHLILRSAGARRRDVSFVQLDHVSKSFGDLRVLDHVSLEVERHNVVCLIGASGSGKSTLLRCINLLEKVDEGRIVVDGAEITNGRVDVNALRRKIGIVFQAYNLFPHMTVLENTLAPKKVNGAAHANRASSRSSFEQIGLSDKANGSPIVSGAARRDRPRSRWG